MRPITPWRRRGVLLFATLASLALTGVAWGQVDGNPPPGTEKEVSLQFREPKPLTIVLEYIRERSGAEIVYDEKNLAGVEVVVDLKKVYWYKALEILAKQYGLVLKDLGNGVVEIYKPPTVTMEFQDAEIRAVITLIAKWADKNVVISDRVDGVVTLRLKNVPWREALEAVVKTRGYELIQETDRIFRVVTRDEIRQQTETKIFPLRFIRPKDVFVPVIRSDLVSGTIASPDPINGFTLLEALRTMLTPDVGRLHYFQETNTVFVTDVKPVLDQIQNIVNKLDLEPQQVYVDVKFVRTRNQDFLDFGFDYPNGVTISQSFGALATRFPFTAGGDGFEDKIVADYVFNQDNFGETSNTAAVPFPVQNIAPVAPAALNPASLASFGTLDFSQTQIIFRLLKQDVRSEILQAPKIVTLDHHEATIFVGRTRHFAQTELVQNDNGTTSVQIVEAEGSPVTEGFQLLISPHIIPGTSQIIMTIIPKNEEVAFEAFGPANQAIRLPQITTQTLITHMILESGQTMVVGGLYTLVNTETVRKIPFLGDIPGLGWIFKFKDVDKLKEDLLIFITPRIVESTVNRSRVLDQEVQEHRRELMEEFQRILGKRGSQPYPGPDGER